MTNYKDMENKLANFEAFTGNSVTAEYHNSNQYACEKCTNGNTYAVYSYSTMMYSKCFNCQYETYNSKKYSMTTSRLQNMLVRIYDLQEKMLRHFA